MNNNPFGLTAGQVFWSSNYYNSGHEYLVFNADSSYKYYCYDSNIAGGRTVSVICVK